MFNIAVVYYSGSGHTKKLVGHVVDGIKSVQNIEAQIIDVANINESDWQNLHQSHAIIFGSPTYMGNVSGKFKSFMDETGNFWIEQKWANKIAAGLTVGTSGSGDKLNSLIQMSVFAAQHGMIWVGQNHVGSKHTNDGLDINDAGSWLGLMAKSDTDKSVLISKHDAHTAEIFGKRVAEATLRWYKQ